MCPSRKLLEIGDFCQEEVGIDVQNLGDHLLPVGPSGQILEELDRRSATVVLDANGDDEYRLRSSHLESRNGDFGLLTKITKKLFEFTIKALNNSDCHRDPLVFDPSILTRGL